MTNELINFQQIQKDRIEQYGFWSEVHKSSLLSMIEDSLNPELMKHYTISDLVLNDGKVLIKWSKRIG